LSLLYGNIIAETKASASVEEERKIMVNYEIINRFR
jgi:hypothetical protein